MHHPYLLQLVQMALFRQSISIIYDCGLLDPGSLTLSFILLWPIVQNKEYKRRHEFYYIELENSWTPSTPTVLPFYHRESNTSSTAWYRIDWSIPVAPSKLSQRLKGHDLRPVWMLVVIPTSCKPTPASK